MKRTWIIALAILAGCAQDSTAERTQGHVLDTPVGKLDDRVSPHGKVRPSIPDSIGSGEVTYDNPRTGTHSDYILDVDYDLEGKPERINWPNGGWTECDRGDLTRNVDGSWEFVDEGGHIYTLPADPNSEPDSGDPDDAGDSGDGDSF